MSNAKSKPEEVQPDKVAGVWTKAQAEEAANAARNDADKTEAVLSVGPLLPEAPIVFWGRLFSPDTGEEYTLTIRGSDPDQVTEAYLRLAESAKTKFGLVASRHAWSKKKSSDHAPEPQAPPPAEPPLQTAGTAFAPAPPPAQPVLMQPPAPAPAPVAAVAPVAAQPAAASATSSNAKRLMTPGETGVYRLYKISVEWLEGDKSKVGFFPYLANGKPGEFATCYEQRPSADEWAATFAPFVALTPDHFRGPKHDLIMPDGLKFVAQASDRLNSKNVPYVDFLRLERA